MIKDVAVNFSSEAAKNTICGGILTELGSAIRSDRLLPQNTFAILT